MLIQIQSTHFEADKKLLKLITTKFEKLEKLYDRIEKCSVTLKHEKNSLNKRCVIEARLVVPGKDLFASEQGETYEEVIDLLTDDLKKQLVKLKNKMLERR
jgi:putative sigma-54 modulation protein